MNCFNVLCKLTIDKWLTWLYLFIESCFLIFLTVTILIIIYFLTFGSLYLALNTYCLLQPKKHHVSINILVQFTPTSMNIRRILTFQNESYFQGM